MTGLTNGTGYLFRVAAINAIGLSQYAQTEDEVAPLAPARVVIGGTPPSATYGAKVTVTATVTNSTTNAPLAGVKVRLYQRQAPATTFALVGTVVTNSSGVVAVPRTAVASTYYQWSTLPTMTQSAGYSAIRLMSTRYVVSAARTPATAKRGQTATVYGTVAGGENGKVVYLQRYLDGQYTSIASTTLALRTLPDGRRVVGFAFGNKLTTAGTYNFRIFVPTGYSLVAGYSTSQVVRAT